MQLGWISKLVSSQNQETVSKPKDTAKPQIQSGSNPQVNDLLAKITQVLNNQESHFSPQELTQQLQSLRSLIIQELGDQVDIKKLDIWLGDFIKHMIKFQDFGNDLSPTSSTNTKPLSTQLLAQLSDIIPQSQISAPLLAKLEKLLLNVLTQHQTNHPSNNIAQGLDKEILGLLERSQLDQLETLFQSNTSTSPNSLSNSLNQQSFKDNLSSELQSWHLLSRKDSSIPVGLEKWFLQNQLTIKIDSKINSPFVIQIDPQGVHLPASIEQNLSPQQAQEFKQNILSQVVQQNLKGITQTSLWTALPTQDQNTIILAPNSISQKSNTSESHQLFQQQSPPHSRSIEALRIINSFMSQNNLSEGKNINPTPSPTNPGSAYTAQSDLAPTDQVERKPIIQPAANLSPLALSSSPTPLAPATSQISEKQAFDTKTSLLNLFQKAIYQFESQLAPGDSPSLPEKEQILKIVLAIKNQGIPAGQIFNSLEHLMKEQNLLEWIRSPESELQDLKKLPPQVRALLEQNLSDSKLMKPVELIQTLEQSVQNQPDLKDHPAVKRLLHFSQWNSLNQDSQTDQNKQQSVYWSNGDQMFHSRIQVQDERQKEGQEDEQKAQRIVIYTQTEALGEINAQLSLPNTNSTDIHITLEDELGKYPEEYQNEVKNLRDDLLNIGFHLKDFLYRAKPEAKVFFTQNPNDLEPNSGIDLKA